MSVGRSFAFDYCDQVIAVMQRCGLPARAVSSYHDHCAGINSHYRPEWLAAASGCLSSIQCGVSNSSPLASCALGATRGLTPTSSASALVTDVCNACPQAGDATTATDCIRATIDRRGSDTASLTATAPLVLFNDQTLDAIRARCLPRQEGSGVTGCALSFTTCVSVVLGLSGAASSDGGT